MLHSTIPLRSSWIVGWYVATKFGQNQAHYEKSYFDRQHDHVILTDTGEVVEFCDPRIQAIKQTIEEVFDITIDNHSLYFYGRRNKKRKY